MEAEIIGAASGSSAVVAVLVIIVRDLIKNRNGGSAATRSDITKLSEKFSSDIGGVYKRLEGFTERCHERHAVLERELGENNQRIISCERDIRSLKHE